MKKIIVVLSIILCLGIRNVKAQEIDLAGNAKSAILIESSTGTILYEKNSHEKLHPASMTKMMSMLLIIEAIEKEVISWDDIVTVSKNASDMGGSQILLEIGEQMSVRDLFKGIAVASGNDAVVAMAEKLAGTEQVFVSMMNNRAKELGLKDTHFSNSHGLDSSDHYSSAYDMSLIAKELVKHEVVLEYTSIYEDYLRKDTDRKFWLVNTNKLVRFYSGVDGLKTGYTALSGHCLTATAKKNNMRIIAVVMGEKDSVTRNSEVSSMLDYGFATYNIEQVLSKNSDIGNIYIENGKQEYVKLVPLEDVTILYKKNDLKPTTTYEVVLDKVKAPIKIGDIVGKLLIKDNSNIIRNVDITIEQNINKANIFELYLRYLKEIIIGKL